MWEYAVVVCRVAACLGPVWGRHGRAAALFWGYERGWIRGSQLASRDATLANALRPSARIATSKPHGGGDGPRLAGVVDRRPLQLRVAVVISFQLPSGVSRSRGNTPAAAYCSAQPDESSKLAFLGMLGAPRVRRLSTSSLGRRTTPWRFLQAARPSPGPSDGDENTALRPRAEGDAGAAVTRVSTHDTRLFVGFAI